MPTLSSSSDTTLPPLYQVTVAGGKLVGVSHDRVNIVSTINVIDEVLEVTVPNAIYNIG